MSDPLDHLDLDELIEETAKHLLTALAKLDDMRRTLHGPRERASDQTRSPRRRGPYPRRVE